MSDPTDLIVHFDGACEPNPDGLATYGYTIDRNGEQLGHGSGVVKNGRGATNNVAEYAALWFALRNLADNQSLMAGVTRIVIRGDSKLVINQLTGTWKCNSQTLSAYLQHCRDLIAVAGVQVVFEWIPRDRNRRADALSTAAWERAAGRDFPEFHGRRMRTG